MAFSLNPPELQVEFATALRLVRDEYLQQALLATVAKLDIRRIDEELVEYANAADLSLLASHGLRGELLFAVPTVLSENPRLLAYYRLLLGYSQKAFFGSATGLTAFKSLEEGRSPSAAVATRIPDLCRALNESASYLIRALDSDDVRREVLDDLCLLTLGPQFRGGANVKRGMQGIVRVFEALHSIVERSVKAKTERALVLSNAARRRVVIELAPDPDIVIREQLGTTADKMRNVVAIEVKAGTDFSNVHNRIGEAEKSHQKARLDRFTECWTVVNVDRTDMAKAKAESPSTDRFYRLSDIESQQGEDFEDFRDRVISLTGIRR